MQSIDALACGGEIDCGLNSCSKITLRHDLSPRQIEIIKGRKRHEPCSSR